MYASKINNFIVKDIRFPTSLQGDGSDPTHPDPDYSCAYVVIQTDRHLEGHGFTFTIGRGTDIVCMAINTYSRLIIGTSLKDIYEDFAGFWRKVTHESQLRWLGPEKGVTHLAVAAIMNALWDLWAKIENKPVWKLLVDMEPEKLLSVVDFSYISDIITKEEALEMLKIKHATKAEREKHLLENGYPAYITSVGWIGYDDQKIRERCQEALGKGWTRFKMKVGVSVEDDRRRAKIIREEIGMDKPLHERYRLQMMDCNQKWEVSEAIAWMQQLAEFKPTWIEEPTSPDDILGHAAIAKALNPIGIGVATGEHCQNRVVFKQLLQSKAFNYCQTDACRIGGINELITVYLMAAKFGVPVCPHAGGVGMCELVQHLSFFDYIAVSGSLENRMTEYADHLHEHMKYPVCINKGSYQATQYPGYSSELKQETTENYEYPNGKVWQKLFADGKFERN